MSPEKTSDCLRRPSQSLSQDGVAEQTKALGVTNEWNPIETGVRAKQGRGWLPVIKSPLTTCQKLVFGWTLCSRNPMFHS